MAKPIKIWTGTEWVEIATAAPSTSDLATTSALTAHEADTTNIHGIADTANLIDKTILDAKGDLIVASADNTPAKLTVGNNGQIPMADSSTTTGLRYVDPPTNRNLIINGAMQVAQRGISKTGITGGGYFTADRWNSVISSLGTYTQTIENDGPIGSGFIKSLKMLVTTASASPAAAGYSLINQTLEGQDLQAIRKGTTNAKQLTASFWVKSNVTGTYICEISDNTGLRVSSSYSISSANTWEQKTITIPAETTIAIPNNNTYGLSIGWWLAAGSNFTSGTLNTSWSSVANVNRVPGQINLASATNNYWQITGVQLEIGPVATPYEFESYERTLRKCQRYYYRMVAPAANYNIGVAYVQAATRARVMIPFPTTMRAAPTSIDTTGVATDYTILNNGTTIVNCSAVPATNGPTVDLGAIDWDVASGLTIGQACLVRLATSGSYIGWNAEL